MNKNKKGVSEVVTVIFLILLAAAAILILFVLIRNMIQGIKPKVESGCMDISIEIDKLDCLNNQTTLKRGAGAAELKQLMFVITKDTGETETYLINNTADLPSELETRTYNLPLIETNATALNIAFSVKAGETEMNCGFAHSKPIKC